MILDTFWTETYFSVNCSVEMKYKFGRPRDMTIFYFFPLRNIQDIFQIPGKDTLTLEINWLNKIEWMY